MTFKKTVFTLIALAALMKTAPAQTVSLEAGGAWGDFRNAGTVLWTQLPMGDAGWAAGLGIGWGYENFENLHWIDKAVRDEIGRIYRLEGDASLTAPLWGRLSTTLALKGGATAAEADFGSAGDPYGKGQIGIAIPLGERVILMPVAAYTFGADYPLGTVNLLWTISEAWFLDAQLISPRLRIAYGFNEDHRLRAGVEYDQRDVCLEGKGKHSRRDRDFFYQRLIARLEYRSSPWDHFAVNSSLEGSFLQKSEYEEGSVTVKDDSGNPDFRAGVQLICSY